MSAETRPGRDSTPDPEYDREAREEARHWGHEYHQRLERGIRHTVDLREWPAATVERQGWGDDRRLLDIIEGDIIRRILQRVRGRPLRVLELACGAGALSLELAREGADVLGIDLSEESVAIARAHARSVDPDNGLRLEYRTGDLNRLSLPRGEFDMVVAHSSLHHIRMLHHVMEQVALSLRPDGEFVLYDNVGQTALVDWLEGLEVPLCRTYRLAACVASLPVAPRAAARRLWGFVARRIGGTDSPFVPAPMHHSPFELVNTREIPRAFAEHFEVTVEEQHQAFVKFFAGLGVAEDVPGWLLYPAVRLLKRLDGFLIRWGLCRGENTLLIGRRRTQAV